MARCVGRTFIQRLVNIGKAVICPSYTSTHLLTDNANFVATVTGTVGWEAICKGKVALVFGKPWYRGLPGVIPFHKNLTYKEINGYTFDKHQFAMQTSNLYSRCHVGSISDYEWTTSKFEYDEAQNSVSVVNSILDLIFENVDTTFSDMNSTVE